VVELSVFCIVVVGDENGVVGHGLGKIKILETMKAVEIRKFSKKFEWTISTTRTKR
jgi:ribosomal protein S5